MKEKVYGYKLILGYFGIFIVMIGCICLMPLVIIPFYPEEMDQVKYFVLPGVVSILFGYLLSTVFRGKTKGNLSNHQDSILVVGVWLIAILISSVPFMLTGKYNFTQSIFEVTSGYSTTGLSVINVNECPRIFLFFRSILLFFGGVGLVLVLTSAISDKYGMRIYTKEGHNDKLLPNLVKSARLILSIYLGYIVLGTVLYLIAGMDLFDSVNHSIACISTGGFSTRAQSIGYYNSLPIELITILLMLLGGTNFIVHLYLLKGKIKNVLSHCEVKFSLILIGVTSIVFAVLIKNHLHVNYFEAVRISSFQIISSITTTGFQTVSGFNILPVGFVYLLILLMLIGGATGSTAGGIKQYRIVVCLKGIYNDIKDSMLNKRIIHGHYINKCGNKLLLTKEETNSTYAFVFLYLIIFATGSIIISSFGFPIADSMFEFASSLSTVGLSSGIVGANCNPVILWVCTVGMFLGRLELLIVFETLIKIGIDTQKGAKKCIKERLQKI